jgi:Bacterial Ig-like domain (group 3)/Putative Ig domain/NHL repeat
MLFARLFVSRSQSSSGNVNTFRLRMLDRFGAVAVLCLAWCATAVPAQTAFFSGSFSTLASLPATPCTPNVAAGYPTGPTGVAVDKNGDVFFTNPCTSTVSEIVAVNGSIPATNPTINTVGSGFNQPYSLVVDGSGNVYVTDYGNQAVKEVVAVNGSVSASSSVITLAGPADFTGSMAVGHVAGPAGIALDGKGDLFVTNFVSQTGSVTNAVQEIVAVNGSVSPSSAIIQLATSFGFNFPEGVAVEANGDVIVADFDSNHVEEIVAANGNVSASSSVVVLATGASFNQPDSVAVDAAGDVIVADSSNNKVKEIVAVNGSVSATSVVNILAPTASFNSPNGVAEDASGNVYVADTFNNAVEEIKTAATSFTAVANATTPLTVPFTFTEPTMVNSVAVLTQGAPNLDFTDAGTGSCTTNGAHTYIAGETCTVDVTFTPKAAGPRYGAVQLISTEPPPPTVMPESSGPLHSEGMPPSSAPAVIVAANIDGIGMMPEINFRPGTQSALIPPTTVAPVCATAPVGSPPGATGTAVDASGNLYIANPCTNTVSEIMAVNGSIPANPMLITLGSGFNQPFNVAVDGSGDVFVTDFGNSLVKEIVAVNGSVSATSNVVVLAASTSFPAPAGIAVDASGNVYVSNFVYNNGGVTSAVEEIVAENGSVSATSSVIQLGLNFTTPISNGFNFPEGLAVDAKGDVFVADDDNSLVDEIVAVDGSVTPTSAVNVLGSGFSHPAGVAVDGNGNVFVADALNGAVKEIMAVNGSIPASNPTINVLGGGFAQPVGVAVGANGNVFVADAGGFTLPSEANTGIGSALYELDYADAPTLTFATSTVDGTTDNTDGALSVQIENNGNEPLTAIAPGLAVSANFMQVNGSGTPEDCTASFSLAADAACNISVAFAPVAPAEATVNGSVTLTDNSLDALPSATQTISLVGTANSLTATTAIPSTTLTVFQLATAFIPVTGSGGAAPLTYSVVPALPAGLSFSAATGAIAGTPTMTSAAVTYTVTVTDTNGATAMATFSLAVAQQPTVTTVTAVPSAVDPVQAVTLTATVSATVAGLPATPTGSVTFFDNGTLLGSAVPLASGAAALVVPSLPANATASITATYSGDGNFLTSTSSSTPVVVAPYLFTFTNTGVSEFTATPGAVATYNFALAPLFGSYPGQVSLSVTGLPTGASASFTPSTVAVGGGNTPIVMMVQTATTTAHNSNPFGRGIVMALLLLPFGIKRSVRKRLNGWMLLSLLLLIGATSALSGCGSNSAAVQSGPQVYTLTVTATSGTLMRSQGVTLLIQK